MTLQLLHLRNMTKFRGYIYLLNHPCKGFIFSYSLSIHTLIFRALIKIRTDAFVFII
jgi:hypothetical protein